MLGLTVPAAKTRLFRARAGVRLHLKPVWRDLSLDSSRRGQSHPVPSLAMSCR